MNSTSTSIFAEWLTKANHDKIPPTVITKANDVLFDAVGAICACSTLPEVRQIIDFLRRFGGSGECSVIGHSLTTTPVSAAMAHGAMAHGDEVDAVHLESGGGHVAAGVVPTALTVGEWLDRSGKDVLRAIILGYELGGRLMPVFYRQRDHIARRFYPTSVIANLSSAVTASILLNLNQEQIQVAMCLAGAYQGGSIDNMVKDPGHTGKTFSVGFANRNGVTAALLASAGSHAPLDILDGTRGVFDAFLGSVDIGKDIAKNLGERFSIVDVMHKRYPAGSPHQTYLQGLFELIETHQVQEQDIVEIEVQMPPRGVFSLSDKRHASIAGSAVCAVAAVMGKLDFYVLHDPKGITDERVHKMQKQVKLVAREDWQALEHTRHAIVTISTRSKGPLRKEVWHEPMTSLELSRKFEALTVPRFGAEKTARIASLLKEIGQAKSIRPLMNELRE